MAYSAAARLGTGGQRLPAFVQPVVAAIVQRLPVHRRTGQRAQAVVLAAVGGQFHAVLAQLRDDKILIVTTDRLSAFDVVMNEPIPGKGKVLNQMSDFWFEKLGHIVPNHLTGVAPESVVAPDEVEQVKGRAVVAKMREVISHQMYDVAIQAAIGSHIISRENVKALRKDVLAKCYGGDISRKIGRAHV